MLYALLLFGYFRSLCFVIVGLLTLQLQFSIWPESFFSPYMLRFSSIIPLLYFLCIQYHFIQQLALVLNCIRIRMTGFLFCTLTLQIIEIQAFVPSNLFVIA